MSGLGFEEEGEEEEEEEEEEEGEEEAAAATTSAEAVDVAMDKEGTEAAFEEALLAAASPPPPAAVAVPDEAEDEATGASLPLSFSIIDAAAAFAGPSLVVDAAAAAAATADVDDVAAGAGAGADVCACAARALPESGSVNSSSSSNELIDVSAMPPTFPPLNPSSSTSSPSWEEKPDDTSEIKLPDTSAVFEAKSGLEASLCFREVETEGKDEV